MKRGILIIGNVALVPLTQGYVATIDAADAAVTSKFTWRALVARRNDGTIYSVYAYCNLPRSNGNRPSLLLHRYLMCAPDDRDVDHIDADGLNCRRQNMRVATVSENHCNQRLSVANSSGYKGVSFDKRRNKWRTRITKNGREKMIGYFDDIADAAAAYASASREYHGQYGRLV